MKRVSNGPDFYRPQIHHFVAEPSKMFASFAQQFTCQAWRRMPCLWTPLFVMMPFIFLIPPGYAADVTLSWDANTEANIADYKIYYYRGSIDRPYPYKGRGANEGILPVDVGNTTTFTLSGLDDTEIYYFVVTAYDTRGIESGYSNMMRSNFKTTKIIDSGNESSKEVVVFVGPSVPVRLPSGIVLELNQQQVEAIKGQLGVFFGAEAANMFGPGDVVVSLPTELGGGYIYGKPEHLAQAFATVGATEGTTEATHLFVKRSSCLLF